MTGPTPLFIAELISKFQQGILTAEEQLQLDAWISSDSRHAQLWAEVNDEQIQQTQVRQMASYDENAALVRFTEKHPAPGETRVISLTRSVMQWKWVAAAVLVFLVGAASWWFLQESKKVPQKVVEKTLPIPAGKSGAILTLADGKQVVLDSAGNGVIASEEGAEAVMQDGKLLYRTAGKTPATISYNTMTIPKGREFRLRLPDGTQVWLNSASSIRYPTVFAGNERKVEITGEAYFAVTPNAKMPFTVTANNKAAIQVLGTEFNIKAYDNEANISTTLIDGSVKVNGTLLKPGQQAQLANAGATASIEILNDVDISKVLAWRNNRFNFEGDTIEEMMRQIERWYDIEVVYEGKKPRIEFEGQMTKDVSLDGLMVLLKKAGIHLRLEGRKLIVLP